MKAILHILSLCTLTAYSQIQSLEPKCIYPVPNVNLEKCEQLVYEANGGGNYYTMSKKEQKLIDLAEEDGALSHFYSPGCSWYCGGIIDTVTASSSFTEEFIATNTHDFRITTVWVEGVKGDGVGEYITYHFPGNCPRITGVSIHNGFVKDKKLWKKYGRVKKLLMYYNDEPYAILNLKDTRDCQNFKIGILGNEIKEGTPAWSVKFEILEVYPGRNHNTAITEIYFDGIDVH